MEPLISTVDGGEMIGGALMTLGLLFGVAGLTAWFSTVRRRSTPVAALIGGLVALFVVFSFAGVLTVPLLLVTLVIMGTLAFRPAHPESDWARFREKRDWGIFATPIVILLVTAAVLGLDVYLAWPDECTSFGGEFLDFVCR